MHNLKIIEEFLGETKSSTAAYIDVREEQRGVSTTKLPIRLGYARGLILEARVVYILLVTEELVYEGQLQEELEVSKSRSAAYYST
ncbi:palindromic element RPE1 domain-containing protein [Candidatus Tisiphia endosymbiont of Beris chalybata]|uniref:palindromic element RPE1 domain-containing protein n=1 Tax=Candidatus Tisiphia endosymbiont of Beris chalybata TaxID=3066262 RepID=UPI00312C9BD1